MFRSPHLVKASFWTSHEHLGDPDIQDENHLSLMIPFPSTSPSHPHGQVLMQKIWWTGPPCSSQLILKTSGRGCWSGSRHSVPRSRASWKMTLGGAWRVRGSGDKKGNTLKQQVPCWYRLVCHGQAMRVDGPFGQRFAHFQLPWCHSGRYPGHWSWLPSKRRWAGGATGQAFVGVHMGSATICLANCWVWVGSGWRARKLEAQNKYLKNIQEQFWKIMIVLGGYQIWEVLLGFSNYV